MTQGSAGPATQVKVPGWVGYASVILTVQAVCWGLLSVLYLIVAVVGVVESVRGSSGGGHGAAWLCLIPLLSGTFAFLKGRLARGLAAGTRRTRNTAVAVEVAMACFGFLTASAAFWWPPLANAPIGPLASAIVIFAFPVGGCLSLAAAIGLMGPPARRYYATGHGGPTRA